jgi:putative ABC transport system permease protein
VPVTIVNDAAVRQFWDGRSPLGQHLEIGKTVYEIVGVVGDMRYRTVTSAPVPEAYIPYLQSTVGGSNLLIRAERGTDIVPAIKAAIWSVNPNLPVPNVKTADQLFARATAPRRFNMPIMSVFAALAVLIAATGVTACCHWL